MEYELSGKFPQLSISLCNMNTACIYNHKFKGKKFFKYISGYCNLSILFCRGSFLGLNIRMQSTMPKASSFPEIESLRQQITTVLPYASLFCQVLPACSTFKQISLYYSSEQCSLKSITEKCQLVFI